ncbi:gamma subclass chorismate mutase AroQ [Shewanella surugensis]|uniref:chorismate mutase n=1 Tax=Shewanella surugensis TaxID=212020 RepID=A0ABT0LIF9_9GAMM|nr:gamma subclass chorismate mutase AroQ [Shewanella surugensis]MCL1127150.1 gamma subclass chorismate mutase AroQ [Shewanella surugensis]
MNLLSKNFYLLCLILLFPLPVLANGDVASIFNTINLRLTYMQDVALYKAQHHLAIEDVAREKKVLASATRAASQLGLPTNKVDAFFKAQIAVAKAIQYRYRAQWLASAVSGNAPRDLQTQVRPALIKLGEQLNKELADYVMQGGRFVPTQYKAFSDAIKVKYVTVPDKNLLFNALMQITDP